MDSDANTTLAFCPPDSSAMGIRCRAPSSPNWPSTWKICGWHRVHVSMCVWRHVRRKQHDRRDKSTTPIIGKTTCVEESRGKRQEGLVRANKDPPCKHTLSQSSWHVRGSTHAAEFKNKTKRTPRKSACTIVLFSLFWCGLSSTTLFLTRTVRNTATATTTENNNNNNGLHEVPS